MSELDDAKSLATTQVRRSVSLDLAAKYPWTVQMNALRNQVNGIKPTEADLAMWKEIDDTRDASNRAETEIAAMTDMAAVKAFKW